jgi:PPP family 3-phenylpropionic acid transporter
VVAFFLSQFALMSSTANMSLYLSAFHPRPSPGIVPLSYGIAATVELPFLMAMGWAADRFGRTLTLAVAFIVLPLRLVAYYLAPTATVAVALQALHGLTFSVLAIVPFAFIADVTPPRYNATGQAVLHAATTAALAVGPAAAGAVAAVVGIRTLYLWLAVAAAAGSVIFFALVREPVRQPAPGPQRT